MMPKTKARMPDCRRSLIRKACLLLLLWPLMAQAGFKIRSVKTAGRTYLSLGDIATYYGLKAGVRGDTIVLYGKEQRLEFTENSRKAMVNGILVHLQFAPRTYNGALVVSNQDFQSFLDPVMRPWGIGRKPVQKVMLDVGHGGKDTGANGSRLKEKDLNLILARRVQAMLEQYGYTVLLTRTDDRYLSLDERTSIAKKRGADLFISIHNNSATAKAVHGIETYLVTPQNGASIHRREPEKTEVPGNAYDRYNARLAYCIHRRLMGYSDAVDRGLKYRRFAVLRTAPCPAVLLETGFLSHAGEEARLATEAYQNNLALAIAHGIVDYHRSITVGPGE